MDLFEFLKSGMTGINGKELDSNRPRTLRDLLDTSFDNQPYEVAFHQLRSKKNVVLKLQIIGKHIEPKDLVAKLFITSGFDRELEILKRSEENNLTVPHILDAKDGVILMEFIRGQVLTDIINETFSSTVIEDLARWYYVFHTIHSLIKGDPRLRNFIQHNQALFGVDFEESREGDWMEDIGGVAASLLDTRPVFHGKKQKLAWHLLECYLDSAGLQQSRKLEKRFENTIAKALKQTSRWRNDSDILMLAKRIEAKGIPKS